MQPLRWEVRALPDPRYVDTAIVRLGWTLDALRDAEFEAARALVAGPHGEGEHLRERYTWQIRCKERSS